mmetsp:Transcript_39401/g.71716  ORF Transcript_39401/g.71716 Transcript_39401/m.71716 type:complete len:222 (-) Transcript_39401:42-707(-)
MVRDAATCRSAAKLAGMPMVEDRIIEGTECHFCGGCDPNTFRLSPEHAGAAKMVCRLDQPQAATVDGALPWPQCLEQDTVIRNAGQGLFTDLLGFGATIGCFLDDCAESDKFDALSMESCGKICYSLPDCQYWVWGQEDGAHKCWFRRGDKGRAVAGGWVSGKRMCVPPGTQVLTRGNEDCWSSAFGYDDCCDLKLGPNGNPACWDQAYNYDMCCFPKEEY